jgi:hypothetical protein
VLKQHDYVFGSIYLGGTTWIRNNMKSRPTFLPDCGACVQEEMPWFWLGPTS